MVQSLSKISSSLLREPKEAQRENKLQNAKMRNREESPFFLGVTKYLFVVPPVLLGLGIWLQYALATHRLSQLRKCQELRNNTKKAFEDFGKEMANRRCWEEEYRSFPECIQVLQKWEKQWQELEKTCPSQANDTRASVDIRTWECGYLQDEDNKANRAWMEAEKIYKSSSRESPSAEKVFQNKQQLYRKWEEQNAKWLEKCGIKEESSPFISL